MLIQDKRIKPGTVKNYIKKDGISNQALVGFFNRYFIRFESRWEIFNILVPYLQPEDKEKIIKKFEDTRDWAIKMEKDNGRVMVDFGTVPGIKGNQPFIIKDTMVQAIKILKDTKWNGIKLNGVSYKVYF